jgi:hypothetical protein
MLGSTFETSFEGSEGAEIRTAHGGALGPVLNEKET